MQLRWRQYESRKDDVDGAYFNPDRYRQWLGAVGMRRRFGSWTWIGSLGGGRETINGVDTHPVRLAEIRGEGALTERIRLALLCDLQPLDGLRRLPRLLVPAGGDHADLSVLAAASAPGVSLGRDISGILRALFENGGAAESEKESVGREAGSRMKMTMSRRRWIVGAAFVVSLAVAAVASLDDRGMAYGRTMPVGYSALHELPARRASPLVEPTLIDLEERTFRFFWDTANPKNGLVPDRYPTPSFASIAAVGFGLTSYPIGVERGYVTRKEARKRVLTTLRFLYNAPQGTQQHGMSGYKGFFYHFLDMRTGERFEDSELSTVDTALLLAGAMFCQSYFDGAIRKR